MTKNRANRSTEELIVDALKEYELLTQTDVHQMIRYRNDRTRTLRRMMRQGLLRKVREERNGPGPKAWLYELTAKGAKR